MNPNLDDLIASTLRSQSQAIPDGGFSRKASRRVARSRLRMRIARCIPPVFAIIGTVFVSVFQIRWSAFLEISAGLLAAASRVGPLPLWALGCVFVLLLASANAALRESET